MRVNNITVGIQKGAYKYNVAVPLICPHCGLGVAPTPQLHVIDNDMLAAIMVCTNQNCKKRFYSIHKVGGVENGIHSSVLLYSYPRYYDELLPKFDKLLEFSPEFAKAYGQAFNAQCRDDEELAAVGYRNAAEILIKDYAMAFLSASVEEVGEKSLAQSINAYLECEREKAAPYIFKCFGDAATHYPPREQHIGFNDFLMYYEIFMHTMTEKIMTQHAVSRLPSQYKTQPD